MEITANAMVVVDVRERRSQADSYVSVDGNDEKGALN